MTLVRTNRLGAQSSTSHGTGAYTPASFTPSNDSRVTVIVGVMEDSGSTDPSGDLTISGGGLSWTPRINVGNASSWSIGLRAWTADVVGTAPSIALSIDCGARNAYWYGVTAVDHTGYGAIGTSVSNAATATNGADSLTLPSAPAATSEIIGAIMQDPNGFGGATPGTAITHTELYDLDSNNGASMQAQVRPPGSTSTAFSWDDVAAGANALFKGVALAIEITEAVTAPTPGAFIALQNANAIALQATGVVLT